MTESVVELVDLSTNETRTARLVGVDISQLDPDTINTIYGFFARSAETDSTLPSVDYNSFRYATLTLSSSSNVIVQKLQIYGDLVENLVEMDEDIKEADNAVILTVLGPFAQQQQGREEIDNGDNNEEAQDNNDVQQSSFNYKMIRDHLFTILDRFFSKERVKKCSPMRLLIDLALVIKYCYNFCKRLVERVRRRLTDVCRANLPKLVFDVLTEIVSAIFAHLVKIQWKTIVSNIGGWIVLAGSVALSRVTQDVLGISPYQPSFYFGLAGISLAIGTYLYFKQ